MSELSLAAVNHWHTLVLIEREGGLHSHSYCQHIWNHKMCLDASRAEKKTQYKSNGPINPTIQAYTYTQIRSTTTSSVSSGTFTSNGSFKLKSRTIQRKIRKKKRNYYQ